MMDKSGSRPFTAELNAKGAIQPQPLLKPFAQGDAVDNEICLELSFKGREPNDRQVIPQIAESVAFWAPHIDSGGAIVKSGSLSAACVKSVVVSIGDHGSLRSHRVGAS